MLRLVEWKLLLLAGLYLIAAGLSAPAPSPEPAGAVEASSAHVPPGPASLGGAPPAHAPDAPPAPPGLLGSLPLLHKP